MARSKDPGDLRLSEASSTAPRRPRPDAGLAPGRLEQSPHHHAGARSTPSEAAGTSRISFFFAFMMPGSDAGAAC